MINSLGGLQSIIKAIGNGTKTAGATAEQAKKRAESQVELISTPVNEFPLQLSVLCLPSHRLAQILTDISRHLCKYYCVKGCKPTWYTGLLHKTVTTNFI